MLLLCLSLVARFSRASYIFMDVEQLIDHLNIKKETCIFIVVVASKLLWKFWRDVK